MSQIKLVISDYLIVGGWTCILTSGLINFFPYMLIRYLFTSEANWCCKCYLIAPIVRLIELIMRCTYDVAGVIWWSGWRKKWDMITVDLEPGDVRLLLSGRSHWSSFGVGYFIQLHRAGLNHAIEKPRPASGDIVKQGVACGRGRLSGTEAHRSAPL